MALVKDPTLNRHSRSNFSFRFVWSI